MAQGGARRLLGPRELLKDSKAAPAPSSSALAGLLGNSMGPSTGDQMYMVVGFEVMACSIARVSGQKPSDVSCIDTLEGKPPAPQEVHKGAAGTPLRLSIFRCTRTVSIADTYRSHFWELSLLLRAFFHDHRPQNSTEACY